jgi:hypothetical protein
VTLTEVEAGPVPFKVTEEGNTEHDERGTGFVQVSEMVPVNPATGLTRSE